MNFQITWNYPFKCWNLTKENMARRFLKCFIPPYFSFSRVRWFLSCHLCNSAFCKEEELDTHLNTVYIVSFIWFIFPILLADTGSVAKPGGGANKSSVECKCKCWQNQQSSNLKFHTCIFIDLICFIQLNEKSLGLCTTGICDHLLFLVIIYKISSAWDFPGGAVVKNLPANAGNTGLNPGPERSHMPRSN